MNEPTFETSVPRFDDEQTVLAARPVVPLEQIDAKVRHRRRWFLGGAFAVAMLLGAASALVASYLKLRNVPNSSNEVSQVDVISSPLVVEEIPAPETLVPETNVVAEPEQPKKAPVAKRQVVPERSYDDELVEPRRGREPSEEEALEQIRESVLYDQWQERRARRVLRRERRRAERENHRDLSNLDEIFEGRPRQ